MVHGFNLRAGDWERVVWGVEPNELGRVPKAILVALQQNASVLAFGTGVVGPEMLECESMYRVFTQRIHRLRNFAGLKQKFHDVERRIEIDKALLFIAHSIAAIRGAAVRRVAVESVFR